MKAMQDMHQKMMSADDADPDAVRDLTGGGAHVTMDALGSGQVVDAALRSLRPRGRHVQVGLMLGEQASAPLPWGLVVARELVVAGSHGMAAADYPAMLQLIADGTVNPGRLVGRVVGLDRAGIELMAMDAPAPSAGITVATL